MYSESRIEQRARLAGADKITGNFERSGICRGAILTIDNSTGLNSAQMTQVVNALPGVQVAKAVDPSAEVFRVDLDCAKLRALAADRRVHSIEAPTA